MESLRTLYRASVMIGTLVVGALAYRAYGPELEKLKPLFTRAVEIASEMVSPDAQTDTPLAEGEAGSAPEPFNRRRYSMRTCSPLAVRSNRSPRHSHVRVWHRSPPNRPSRRWFVRSMSGVSTTTQ
jgi:hypothetical protein